MSTPSASKGKRAAAQEKPVGKAKGRPSLLKRLTTPACGGLLTALSPAAQRKELERLAAELEYTDDPEQTPNPAEKSESANTSEKKAGDQ